MKKKKTKASLTSRERLLLLVLPGALILAVYALINQGHISALNSALAQISKLRAGGASSTLDTVRLASAVKKAKMEQSEAQRLLDSFNGGSDPMQRAESVLLIGELLRKHGLRVVDEGPSTQRGSFVSRPVSKVKAGTAPPAESVWQVRFLGPWSGVQAALEELPKLRDSACLPLGLSMAEPQSTGPEREWTMRVRL
jgi:hypothetical protein